MIVEIFALCAIVVAILLGIALLKVMDDHRQLQEDHDLLKICHDDHYQSMLALGEQCADLEEALEFYADVGKYTIELEPITDFPGHDELSELVWCRGGPAIQDCGKIARQALGELPDRSDQEDPQPREGWQKWDWSGGGLYHYIGENMITLCGLTGIFSLNPIDVQEIPEDQLCPECLEALRRECPYEVVG
jgi:hypothetical protein